MNETNSFLNCLKRQKMVGRRRDDANGDMKDYFFLSLIHQKTVFFL